MRCVVVSFILRSISPLISQSYTRAEWSVVIRRTEFVTCNPLTFSLFYFIFCEHFVHM